jgi:transposase
MQKLHFKYPKYPKRLNLRCKLLEKDIKSLRSLYKNGWSIKKLAKKFRVSVSAISYWLLSDSRRKFLLKKHYRDYQKERDQLYREEKLEILRKCLKRKWRLMHQEMLNYARQFNRYYSKKRKH